MGNINTCKPCNPCLDKIHKLCNNKDIILTEKKELLPLPLSTIKHQTKEFNFELLKKNKTNIFSETSKSKEYTKCNTLLSKKITIYDLSNSLEIFLIDCLKKVTHLKNYSYNELAILTKSMHVVDCFINDELVNESNPILFLFIVQYGMFIVKDGNNEILLKESSIFGESSLIKKTKLNGLIKCISDARIYALNKKDFSLFVKSIKLKKNDEKYKVLKSLPIISK
jgi:hypothetical protein